MRSVNAMSALVTGGGPGIGEACARHFAARDAPQWTTGAILDVDGGMGLGLSRI